MSKPRAEFPCPVDGWETEWEAECPTYRSSRYGWMRCAPTCGNASRYTCTNPDCDWEYLQGVNWDNPNWGEYRHLQGARPDWMGEA